MFRKRPPSPPPTIEWMMVGLGNPGAQYRGTRHNVGFAVIELLADRNRIKLDRGRNRAIVGVGAIEDHAVVLVKPTTYMNLSGQAVAPLAKQLSVKPSHVLIIADDLDLPLGKLRLRAKGSSGGHNGHRSVAASLQTTEYPRLKIGIGSVDRNETVDHVLSTFGRNERECADQAILTSAQIVEAVVKGEWESALKIVETFNKIKPT
jgi:peptidyl-tRNA hydrolase, PTH1 family